MNNTIPTDPDEVRRALAEHTQLTQEEIEEVIQTLYKEKQNDD